MKRRIRVFAVEDTTAQVCWASLGTGKITLEAGGRETVVDADGRPGAALITGLDPATRYRLTINGTPAMWFDTLAPPPGRLLCRFATVTDIHLGSRTFGAVLRLPERVPPGIEPHPLRCTRAALDEALAWGAESIVVKGDVTAIGAVREFVTAATLLASLPVPVDVVPGNHDLKLGAADMRAIFRDYGIDVGYEPWHRDLPGIRLVMGLTALPRFHHGEVWPDQRNLIAELLAAAPRAGYLGLHHYPQRFEWANVYPPGVPASQATPLLEAIAAANPATLVSSGHTHRHRRHFHGPLVVAETGSTKDYPGTWTGYAVHEGGIRQVTRRVMAPDAIRWTERTRRAMAGWWGEWSPGPRSHRCFTHIWPPQSRFFA
jgi:predicted phosphodiesterase